MPKSLSLDDIITEIEQVFADHVRRPPLAHEVAAYNQVHAAFEHLKARIVALVTGKPAPASPSAAGAEPAAEASEAPQQGTQAESES